jgi:hypothetical protein
MPELVDVFMEEYKVLRDEIVQSLSSRLQILSFGLATVGVLVAGATTALSRGETRVAPIVLLVMVPAACLATEEIWYSEVRRGRRASWYLWGLERKINSQLSARALEWEGGLRGRVPQLQIFSLHYWYVIGFFSLIGLVSVVLGVKFYTDKRCYLALFAITWTLVGVVPFIPALLALNKFDRENTKWPTAVGPDVISAL